MKRFRVTINAKFEVSEFDVWPEELDEGQVINAHTARCKLLGDEFDILNRLADIGFYLEKQDIEVEEV
jgi:hypothetical protein